MRKLIALAALLACLPVRGDSLSLSAENDLFFGDTDQYYTHGTRFSYLDESEGFLTDSLNAERYWQTYSFAQYLYTPNDITVPTLQTNDRPYAAWLYAEWAIFAQRGNVQDSIAFDLGVVGPAALGEQMQTFVHENVGSDIPQGWDNQINNEIGLNAHYQRKMKLVHSDFFDLLPYAGASLGNIHTLVDAGFITRFGYNIPDDFGPLRMEPVIHRVKPRLSIYGIGGAETRYVFRNIFLDGNTFSDSHSVDKEPIVTDLSYGLGAKYRNVGILMLKTIRSQEFEGQDGDVSFGSIYVDFSFLMP